MNLDFNILVFLTAFIFALPIIGYLFRFNIPISLFFFIAGVFMLSILLVTDGIILNDRIDQITSNNGDIIVYNVDSGSGNTGIHNGTGFNLDIIGEYATASNSEIYNQEINCMTWFISRVGSPPITTLLRFGVFDPVTGIEKVTFGTLNATLLTTNYMEYKRCLSNGETYTIQVGDRIGVSYTNGNSTNFVQFFTDGTNPFDSTITTASRWNDLSNSWINLPSTDIFGSLTLEPTGQEGDVYTYEDNIMDISFTGDNYQIKVILIFISIMFMVGGALVEVKSRR